MTDGLDVVPVKRDPFEKALKGVEDSRLDAEKARTGRTRSWRTWHFGGSRTYPHNGIDLFVNVNTPIQVPAHPDKSVFLIGVTRHDSPAGRSMGNALVFFVPDAEKPYFLAFLHLSDKTFKKLNEMDVGRELLSESGKDNVVAYSGRTAAGKGPHLHVTALTSFAFGGKTYTAEDFMKLHSEGKLRAELNKRNFFAVVSPHRTKNPKSMVGYLDPEELIRQGRLRVSSLPAKKIAAREEPRKQALR